MNMKPRGIPAQQQQQQQRPAQEHPSHKLQQQPQTVVGQATKTMISTDKNLMPSMIARLQQQQQQQSGSANNNNNHNQQQAEVCWPPRGLDNLTSDSNTTGQQRQMFDQDGLVLPRRVLYQPPSSVGGQQPTTIRDLNRELKFNQIQGKNVLDNKSELKKALEKLEANKRRKEAEQERLNRRTSLELRLEERAERIARESGASSASSSNESPATITNYNNNSTSGQQMGNNVIQ